MIDQHKKYELNNHEEFFSGIGRLLTLFFEPNEPVVRKIIEIVSQFSGTDEYYSAGLIIDYLYKYKDSSLIASIGDLLARFLEITNKFPIYSSDKIESICKSLKDKEKLCLLKRILNSHEKKILNNPSTEKIKKIYYSGQN